MGFVQNTLIIARHQLGSMLYSRRMLSCLALASAPPLLAYFAGAHEDGFEVLAWISLLFTLQVVAPFIGLIMGSTVIAEEVENRTLTYVFTRPIQRAAFFCGRLGATLGVSALLLVASSGALVWTARATAAAPERIHPDLITRFLFASVLATALYALLSAGLGVFFKRAMIIALGYAFAVEGFLANIPGSSQKLSLQFYLRGILTGLGEQEQGPEAAAWREIPLIERADFLPPDACVLRLLVLFTLLLVFCTWAIRRRQFVLSA